MDPVSLTSERLLLRPPEPADVDAVHAACQDPDIQRWTTVPAPYELRHAEDFVLRICPSGWRDNTVYNFAVTVRETGALAGVMGLVGITPGRVAERVAEIGYWTAKEQRGRGYTAEAAETVARWAFGPLKVDRLEWYAEAGNEGSRAVARKAGFQMEGTQRSRLVHRGTRRDAWVGSLLPSDLGLQESLPYLPES
ncbi:GNAT family N-acetyltransferase [Streptomyces boninensis]|uniref:GNAT family N-acetyltransferase n=1 Tax=Streptomyces boninensis TaxID=2039455 RepID=UPI003B21410E